VSEDLASAPPREGARYRAAIGFTVLIGGLSCVLALFFVPIPEPNKEAVMLAIGLVLGWGATVIGYEFGSSPSGRKAAEAGIKKTTGDP
jgi:hypothetical protein